MTTAWILSGALLLAGLAGFATFLIGIYVLPAAAALIVALARTASGQRGTASPSAPHHR